jgi:RimJ/RimL family protein N-acetyltransferase
MRTEIWNGDRVRLRALEPEDWPLLYAWNQDMELMRHFESVQFPPSRAGAKKWVEEQVEKNGEKDQFTWIIENVAGEPVGTISTFNVHARHGSFFHGISIGREHRRQGYAAEALRLVLRFYFDELRYEKCTAIVYDFNEVSQRMHESLGFKLEGRLRRMGHGDGRFFDHLMYGIVAVEFRG